MNCGFVIAVVLLGLLAPKVASAPVNDHLVNAIPLTGSTATFSGTNVDATKEVGEPNHGANPGGKSVWWSWTAPGSGSVIVETTGSSFDTLLAAYTGSSFASLDSVARNDDAGSRKTSLVSFNVSADRTYRIVVDGYSGDSGDIQLALRFRETPLTRPANDNFADRAVLEGPFASVTGATFLASKEPDEPNHADELGGASIWWSWTAPSTGGVTIDTEGSSFDTLLAVYTGSELTNLFPIAHSDDISTNDPSSSVTFKASAGTEYQIAVDGFAGGPGDVLLRVAMSDGFRLAAPRRLSSGAWQISLTSMPGQTSTIEVSADLAMWTRLATVTNSTALFEFTDTTAPTVPQRFYRAVRLE